MCLDRQQRERCCRRSHTLSWGGVDHTNTKSPARAAHHARHPLIARPRLASRARAAPRRALLGSAQPAGDRRSRSKTRRPSSSACGGTKAEHTTHGAKYDPTKRPIERWRSSGRWRGYPLAFRSDKKQRVVHCTREVWRLNGVYDVLIMGLLLFYFVSCTGGSQI